MTTPRARCQDVGKQYRTGQWAVRGVSLEVPAGALIALVGVNGSGKSTLLRLLAGSLLPDTGQIWVDDNAMGTARSSDMRGRASLVAQEPALDPDMTVREHLAFFGALYSLSGSALFERTATVVAALELAAFADQRVAELSGGQRMRTHLAVGAMAQSALWLLDEPSAALDPESQAMFWRYLRSYPGTERACVVATHDLPAVAQHCDLVGLMQAGQLLRLASPAALMSETQTTTLGEACARLTGQSYTQMQAAVPPLRVGGGPGSGQGRGPGSGAGGGRGRGRGMDV